MAKREQFGNPGALTAAVGRIENTAMKLSWMPVPLLSALIAACAPGQARQDAGADLGSRDLSAVITLAEGGECRFDPLTEHAFDGLLLMGAAPGGVVSAPVVAIGDGRFAPQFERKAMARSLSSGRPGRNPALLVV